MCHILPDSNEARRLGMVMLEMSNTRSDTVETATARPTPLRRLPAPRRLWAPCGGQPKAVGTGVRRGEPLAIDVVGFPAPVDGTIVGTEHRTVLGGPQTVTVALDAQPHESAEVSAPTSAESVRQTLARLPADRAAGVERLQAAGVSADRWTSPDLLGQLRQMLQRPIDAVVCSALDLDPVLPLQRTLATAYAMDVAAGVGALVRLSGASQGLIAVAEDTPAAGVAALRSASAAASVRLFPLPDEYPRAHPSLLVRQTLRRRLPPDQSPTEAGVVLLDAAAALAIGRCFLFDEPMISVPLGVYDGRHGRAHLLQVPVGTSLADVLPAADVAGGASELRAGHFLRELPVPADAIVAASEVTIFAAEPEHSPEPAACLRCGFCVDACPARIHPAGLLEACQQQDPELADHFGIRSCIDCGICSYVCPSRLPLLSSIRLLRRNEDPPTLLA